MKRLRWIPVVIGALVLAGCTPDFKQEEETELLQQEAETEVETTLIPNNALSENYYKTLIPYKESPSRGIIVSKVNTKYDMREVENGLMRLSQHEFDTENYFFQEGQYLSRDMVLNWLARSNQTEETAPADQQGLNPPDVDAEGNKLDPIVKAETAPVYLAHIVEQNYLVRTGDNKVGLGGISIGLALNSIYYYTREQYGETYEQPIDDKVLEQKGKEIANEIVRRMRARSDIPDVPIVIGLYKQQEKNSIVPGTYFAYSVAAKGEQSVDDWKAIKEQYVTFPMVSPVDIYRDINSNFQNFKQGVDEYFSNFTSVIGTGFYQNDSIQSLKIEVPIQFYGTSEIIGFTQYLTDMMLKEFPIDLPITVSITSINGPEALIKKDANNDEPFVHIYE